MVDRILSFRVLAERLRDFRTGLLAAYVDFRKAFASINRHVIIPKLVNQIYTVYSGTEGALRRDGTIFDYLHNGGVLP